MKIAASELPALLHLHAQQMKPRMSTIDLIVAEIMGVPIDDLVVRQAAFCTMAPSIMLLIGPPGMAHTINGSDLADSTDLPALAEALAAYALAGIEALGALAGSRGPAQKTATAHAMTRRLED